MEIDPELHAPPLLGGFVVIVAISLCAGAVSIQKFTMFDTDGRPVRAV